MTSLFAPASFLSVWYWVLSAVVWSVVCNHILGVPYDMLWRARRVPRVAEQAIELAQMTAERVRLFQDRAGSAAAAIGGFVLAVLFTFGFLLRVEPAQAAFCLLFPLAIVAYSTMRLAQGMNMQCFDNDALLLILARRRMWHQFIAVVAIFFSVGSAFTFHAPH